MPALRICPSLAGGLNGVTPSKVSIQLPPSPAVRRGGACPGIPGFSAGWASAIRFAGRVHCAANHQATHAMHQHAQLLHRLRPVRHQLFQQSGQIPGRFAEVVRARVVAAGRPGGIAVRGQRRAVVASYRGHRSQAGRTIADRSCTGHGLAARPCRWHRAWAASPGGPALGLPAQRHQGVASGLWVCARRSPSTPLRAASTAWRSGVSSGASTRDSAAVRGRVKVAWQSLAHQFGHAVYGAIDQSQSRRAHALQTRGAPVAPRVDQTAWCTPSAMVPRPGPRVTGHAAQVRDAQVAQGAVGGLQKASPGAR